MPTPTKPFAVLTTEKKSHRTKAELEKRKVGEEALESGTALKERPATKSNNVAHKEFQRINKLLKNIKKNDGLYEAVINRYCILNAECHDFEIKREEIYELIFKLREEFQDITEDMDKEDKAGLNLEYAKAMGRMTTSIINLDKQIQAKRKMLLDIERENIMTIASALRSIPKKVDDKEEEDPMANLLNRRRS